MSERNRPSLSAWQNMSPRARRVTGWLAVAAAAASLSPIAKSAYQDYAAKDEVLGRAFDSATTADNLGKELLHCSYQTNRSARKDGKPTLVATFRTERVDNHTHIDKDYDTMRTRGRSVGLPLDNPTSITYRIGDTQHLRQISITQLEAKPAEVGGPLRYYELQLPMDDVSPNESVTDLTATFPPLQVKNGSAVRMVAPVAGCEDLSK